MAVAIDFDAVMVPGRTSAVPSSSRVHGSARAAAPRSSEHTCLVATGDGALRRRLVAASELVGWGTAACPVSAAACRSACRLDHRLVVIDLVSPPDGDRAQLEVLSAELASRPGTLLVVCGAADDRADEVWARSLGAFVFVSGVTPGDALISVFREALAVAEQLQASRDPVSTRGRASRPACFSE